jgi:glycosyltransferase involved in cell wall biosynthesis
MDNEVKVSICCTTYNHEKYIKRTLEGFLAQKTNFKYEIIIHDDASTDHTVDIIKSYEREYPDIIHGIYQQENQYSKGKRITQDFIAPKTKGKYVAICEGDDYWTSSYKLQKQVEALEQNKDCFFCVHSTKEVDERGEETGVLFPSNGTLTGVIPSEKFLKMTRNYSFHTSSYLFNGDKWRQFQKNPPQFKMVCPVGDETYMLYFAYIGNVYYIQDVMSCYRRGVPSSWSQIQNSGNIVKKKCNNVKKLAETMKLYDEYTAYRYHDICTIRRAYYLKTAWLLEGTTAKAFKSESKELLSVFPLEHKIVLLIAAVFPEVTKKIYKEKLINANKKKGY